MYCKVKNTFWHVFQVCFKNFLILNKVFNHLRNTSHWNKCYFYLYLHHWFHLSWALTWIFISVIHSIGKPKIKMYKTPEGSFKGDARCCYLKVCLNCITLIWWVFCLIVCFLGCFFFLESFKKFMKSKIIIVLLRRNENVSAFEVIPFFSSAVFPLPIFQLYFEC